MAGLRWRRIALAAVLPGWIAGVALAADADRGRALYEGREVLRTAAGQAARACADCHRPSGMGTFEGRLAVAPITGPTLFQAYDPDVAHFFPPSAQYRVRPAYDEAKLAALLRSGVAPDGKVLNPAMPRYLLDDAQAADLAAHLRRLSAQAPPGIDADTVHLATVTVPGVDPARREAMLSTLRRFVEQKNGQSRHEVRRAELSLRTREMAKDRKYRVWDLQHWQLEGDASTWAAQLEALQARRPVFALIGGLGRSEWAPVDRFCERHRLLCLLPLVDAPAPNEGDRYSVHFHAGLGADARLAASLLRGHGASSFVVRGDPDDPAGARLVSQTLSGAGLRAASPGDAGADIVSLLPPAAHVAWLRASRPQQRVVWLAGAHALGAAQAAEITALTRSGWVVSPMQTGADLERQLRRARAWARANGLPDTQLDVTASTMLSAATLGEAMTHADFGFTPEYLLELLEHGLENMFPTSPYPRLSLGPGQRIASKGSWVGEIRPAGLAWQWQGTR
ncbi:MAG: c-type cytochrome [Piscinibacter sp.]